MKRTPLRRVGAKARRERPALTAAREIVRARFYCEAAQLRDRVTGEPVCGGPFHREHRGVWAHHMWPEDRDRGQHDPERMLYLCHHAHRWTHDHPALASQLGLMRPETP